MATITTYTSINLNTVHFTHQSLKNVCIKLWTAFISRIILLFIIYSMKMTKVQLCVICLCIITFIARGGGEKYESRITDVSDLLSFMQLAAKTWSREPQRGRVETETARPCAAVSPEPLLGKLFYRRLFDMLNAWSGHSDVWQTNTWRRSSIIDVKSCCKNTKRKGTDPKRHLEASISKAKSLKTL